MHPERESPYWDRIVGNDWPEISPSAWNALETAAREGADALNSGDAAQALRGFDETVRASEALKVVRDAMAVLQHKPQAFADALYAAADTYGDIAGLARRTRNQILDVVDNATTRIRNETRGDNDGDGETDNEAEAAADAATTDKIVKQARAEVVDIVNTALASFGPRGLPSLDDIAEALGQPGPWNTGSPLPEHPRRAPNVGGGNPNVSVGPGHNNDGVGPHPGSGPLVPPSAQPFGPLFPPIDAGIPGADAPPALDTEQQWGPEHGETPPAAPDEPRATDVGTTPPVSDAQPAGHRTDFPPGTETGAGSPVRPASNTTGAETSAAGRDPEPEDTSRPEDASGPKGASGPKDASGPEDTGAASRREERGKEHGETFGDTGRTDAAAKADLPPSPTPGTVAAGPTSAAVPTIVPQPPGTAPSTGVPPAASTAPAQHRFAPPQPVEAPRVQPAASVKLPGSPGAVPHAGVTAATAGGVQPSPRDQAAIRRPGEDAESSRSGNEIVRDAVGAAMKSSAAPSFVVGERVDGDLILARTLLGSIRTAVGSWLIGVDWAVSVMRHQSGVSAFVTSNEGRGWLPARLFLPREVSTPWQWSVSENAGWEGVADPARVLAEFAFAWGGKSGAKLSALVSSQPIDPGLRRQLGEIATAGSVSPSAEMDLSSPSGGTLDRLGITGSPRLLDRAAKAPDGSVALRCLELAVDAHIRVEQAGYLPMESVDAPGIRLRILRALRRGREFPTSWWEELQDADDLLAASVLSHRSDVSRVTLGELRSDQSSGHSESELMVLRELTFHRRCNELVLLLAEEVTRQTLRDAVFAHAQILSHPLFAHRSPTDSGGPERRSTVSAFPPR